MRSLPDKLQDVRCAGLSLRGVWKTFLPGATIISFFLERIRRKVRSFWESISRTVLRAFKMKLCMRPAYCVVVGLSMVLLMGMPAGRADSDGAGCWGAFLPSAHLRSPNSSTGRAVTTNATVHWGPDGHRPVPRMTLRVVLPSSLANEATETVSSEFTC